MTKDNSLEIEGLARWGNEELERCVSACMTVIRQYALICPAESGLSDAEALDIEDSLFTAIKEGLDRHVGAAISSMERLGGHMTFARSAEDQPTNAE